MLSLRIFTILVNLLFAITLKPLRIITGMDRIAPEWASITGLLIHA